MAFKPMSAEDRQKEIERLATGYGVPLQDAHNESEEALRIFLTRSRENGGPGLTEEQYSKLARDPLEGAPYASEVATFTVDNIQKEQRQAFEASASTREARAEQVCRISYGTPGGP